MLPYFFSLLLFAGGVFQPDRPLDPGSPPESRAGDVAPATDYEASLTALLGQVVTETGRVRYDLLAGPLNTDFRRVLKAVEDFDAGRLRTRQARLAFWLNAYNVQMLQNIVETPDAHDIIADGLADRFFKTPYRTAGRGITLDQIEHVILRGQKAGDPLAMYGLPERDPRIHVGLNCAAVSCPRLRRRAFTATTVDAELDAALREFADSPAHFRREGEGFVLSALLDWFGSDFDSQGLPAGDYLLRFMSPNRPDYAALSALLRGRNAAALKALPNVRFAYDWTVNRADS